MLVQLRITISAAVVVTITSKEQVVTFLADPPTTEVGKESRRICQRRRLCFAQRHHVRSRLALLHLQDGDGALQAEHVWVARKVY